MFEAFFDLISIKDRTEPVRQIDITAMKFTKVTSSIWGTLENTIVTGHETGELMLWDLRKQPNELLTRTKPHNKQIMDLQKDKYDSAVISASKDTTAKVTTFFKNVYFSRVCGRLNVKPTLLNL